MFSLIFRWCGKNMYTFEFDHCLFSFFSFSIRNIWSRRCKSCIWLNTSSKFVWSHHAPGAIVCITDWYLQEALKFKRNSLSTAEAILALLHSQLNYLQFLQYFITKELFLLTALSICRAIMKIQYIKLRTNYNEDIAGLGLISIFHMQSNEQYAVMHRQKYIFVCCFSSLNIAISLITSWCNVFPF